MSITISPKPSGNYDLVCRFYDGKLGLHAEACSCDAQGRTGKLAEWFSGSEAGLCYCQSATAHKWLEREEAVRVLGGTSVRKATQNGAKRVLWLLDGAVSDEQFSLLAQGALLCSYRFDGYRSGNGLPVPKVTIAAGPNAARFRKLLARLEAINIGQSTARDLANLPPNDLPPQALAARAQELAKTHGLVFKQLKADQLAKEGYIGLTAVGQGSSNPPVLFTLEYRPKHAAPGARPLCLVGKGITFDTGGISIKPWDGMWDMKADMGGSACVVGAMQAIALLAPPVPVVGVVASAENMPDGNAFRPGDVLRYRNGKTVEIRSTDAEGRLVLADALIYAQETLGQTRIVDFATLTGACARALGTPFIGLMSRSRDFAAEVGAAGAASGDATWELPLALEYRPQIDGAIADLLNSGGPLAGAQTAGWFLQEFINAGTDYVHLDIAGTFLTTKADKYYGQPGATGTGVRLAVALAEASAGSAD
jgi:leucyl aminopeptidase